MEKYNYAIPNAFIKKNLFIQIVTNNKFTSTTYFSTSLNVQLIENYGQIKVFDINNKPLTKVYVKCFAKTKAGVVNFYKDGYTDLRGRFDYATLNASEVTSIEKFSIFVMSDQLGFSLISTQFNNIYTGSMIKEANPPSTIGKVEGPLVLKSKNSQWQDKYQGSLKEGYYQKSKNPRNEK